MYDAYNAEKTNSSEDSFTELRTNDFGSVVRPHRLDGVFESKDKEEDIKEN